MPSVQVILFRRQGTITTIIAMQANATLSAFMFSLTVTLSREVLRANEQIEKLGQASGAFRLAPTQQELVFMGERCEDAKQLSDYGVNQEWIVQVWSRAKAPRYSIGGCRWIEGCSHVPVTPASCISCLCIIPPLSVFCTTFDVIV